MQFPTLALDVSCFRRPISRHGRFCLRNARRLLLFNFDLPSAQAGILPFLGWATSSTPQTTTDPAEVEALQCLEEGTQKLEEGDVQGAKEQYRRSAEIKRTASALFNLGVTHYHLS